MAPQFVSLGYRSESGKSILWLFLFGDLPPGFSSIIIPTLFLFLHQENVCMTEDLLSMKEFPERMDRILTIASCDGKHGIWWKSLSSNTLSWKGPQSIVVWGPFQCLIIVFTNLLCAHLNHSNVTRHTDQLQAVISS